MKNILVAFIALISTTAFANPQAELTTSHYFDKIKKNPIKLEHFLYAMPKGADLHLHQSGAAFAENLVRYAANDHLCLNRKTYEAYVNPQCESENLLENALTDAKLMEEIVEAWSMKNFKSGKESGHDHFFAAFNKFSLITRAHHGEMLAEISQRAEEQNESYIEVMLTTDAGKGAALGEQVGWNDDPTIMWEKIQAANLADIVKFSREQLTLDETKKENVLGCKANPSHSGCSIKVRYISQVGREQAPARVFGQLVAAFELAKEDPRVVGLNLVQAEDGPVSSRDYDLQMKMIAFLRQKYPTVHVTLHAGEMSEAITAPELLKFHIRHAVEIAKAERIGHGTDIAKETDYESLLTEMADRHILVEANLSSNQYILNVIGKDHPLPLYLQYGVPVSLSTDDEGVSRDTLTTEYIKATHAYDLTYATVKTLVRNSVAYSFLPGKKLWRGHDYRYLVAPCQKDILATSYPSKACRQFLAENEKANMQWLLEERFKAFENKRYN